MCFIHLELCLENRKNLIYAKWIDEWVHSERWVIEQSYSDFVTIYYAIQKKYHVGCRSWKYDYGSMLPSKILNSVLTRDLQMNIFNIV